MNRVSTAATLRRPIATGAGRIGVRLIDGKSALTELASHTPLKLMAPRSRGEFCWIFNSSLGGGLLDGDSISLSVSVGAGCNCLLSTQSAVKVCRSLAGGMASNHLSAEVDAGATLIVLPDPVICFAESSFLQQQEFHLNATGNLVVLDWFTSGRRSRGERWKFRSLQSDLAVSVDKRVIFNESLSLRQEDGDLAGSQRMGATDCFATVVLVGPRFAASVASLLADIAMEVPGPCSASPIAGGCVLRVCGGSAESVGGWLRKRLEFLEDVASLDPWARRG